MKQAAPLIIIFVILCGIVAWGFMTDWTFSGLLPRKDAKCTPEKDDKDENATKYVYDEDEECTVIETCKTGWEPNTSNTACEYSKAATECTPTGTTITNGKYTFDETGACKFTSCKNDFKINSAKTACDTCKNDYIKNGTVCRKCKDTDVPALPSLASFKDIPGVTYKTENGNCIPNRMIFGGNDGTVNCDTYCAGTGGVPWNTVTPPEWKGAKCVGVTAGNDFKTFSSTTKCETKRGENVGNENRCVCERNDATPWVNNGWTPTAGERLFGKDNITKSWLEGVAVTDAGNDLGIQFIKTSDGVNPKNATECLALAKTKGYKALGVRTAGTCWGLKAAGLNKGTGMHAGTTAGTHYMVCVDDKTKKISNKCA